MNVLSPSMLLCGTLSLFRTSFFWLLCVSMYLARLWRQHLQALSCGAIRASILVCVSLYKVQQGKIDKHSPEVSWNIAWSNKIHAMHQLLPWRDYWGRKMTVCAHSLRATCSTTEHLEYHSSESFLKKGVCVRAYASVCKSKTFKSFSRISSSKRCYLSRNPRPLYCHRRPHCLLIQSKLFLWQKALLKQFVKYVICSHSDIFPL